AGATYSYRVTTLYGSQETALGTQRSFTLTGANTKLAISWTAAGQLNNASPTGYRVWRKRTDGGAWDDWYLVGQTATASFTDGDSESKADSAVYATAPGSRLPQSYWSGVAFARTPLGPALN